MKALQLIFFILLIPTLAFGQPVKIIFDTDMESDVDDVGALAMLHGFSSRGQAEILATISSSLNPWAAPVIDVVNTYFGQPDIPIGNIKTFGVYRNSKYAKTIADKYPKDLLLGEQARDAVEVYREILSKQPDTSVVIVTVGYVSNLSNLLKSKPDEISALSGDELVQQKVKHLVCMGGRYPFQADPGRWGNFKPDPQSTQHIAKEWPTKIIFTAGGAFADDIPTGKILFSEEYRDNPISEAYQIFLTGWNRNFHHSADLIAVYVAVKGNKPYFKIQTKGYNHIFENGTNLWRVEPDDPRHVIIGEFADQINPDDIAREFDKLLVK